MPTKNSYCFSSFLLLLLAAISFLFFKSILPSSIFPDNSDLDDFIVVDEFMKEAMEESEITKDSIVQEQVDDQILLDSLNLEIEKSLTKITDSIPQINYDFYLNHFYAKLFKLEETQGEASVRIAYFGDSMNDGDMIVQDLRNLFMDKYGGAGVGFVNIGSESASSRGSISHKFSKSWETHSYMKNYSSDFPYGVSGQIFYANDTTEKYTVQYARGIYSRSSRFMSPVLYYGASDNQEGRLLVKTDSDTLEFSLTPNQRLNLLPLQTKASSKYDLEFIHADSIPIYGFDFNGRLGVQVDNYSSRGNSGLPLTGLNIGLMQEFQKHLQYDLIILQYGTNVLSENMSDYSWYKTRMMRVVNHLRRAFPETSILVVSVADRSRKYGTEMKTDTILPYLLKAQESYAKETKASYFNLFEAMGGEDSMVEWVEGEPDMANKDYTHFNHRGARKVAGMLFDFIEDGYETFKKEKIEIEKAALELEKLKQREQDRIDSLQALRERIAVDSIIDTNENYEVD